MNSRNGMPYESVHPVQIRTKFVHSPYKRIIYLLYLLVLREIGLSQVEATITCNYSNLKVPKNQYSLVNLDEMGQSKRERETKTQRLKDKHRDKHRAG
jgi:hypothetical protein